MLQSSSYHSKFICNKNLNKGKWQLIYKKIKSVGLQLTLTVNCPGLKEINIKVIAIIDHNDSKDITIQIGGNW